MDRWLTSPISVDTDGDARSADPSSSASTLPPNAAVFDGAELYDFVELAKDPAERGPLKLNATSPTLDDTDGDNVRDTDEIDTPVRTPLLADMPQLTFEIVDDIDMRLDIEYAEEERRSTAFEVSFTKGQSIAVDEPVAFQNRFREHQLGSRGIVRRRVRMEAECKRHGQLEYYLGRGGAVVDRHGIDYLRGTDLVEHSGKIKYPHGNRRGRPDDRRHQDQQSRQHLGTDHRSGLHRSAVAAEHRSAGHDPR